MQDMRIGRSLGKRKTYLIFVLAGVIMIGALVLLAVMMADSTPERNIYSNTTNQELKSRVSRLVKEIRELVYAHKNRDRQLLDAYEEKNRPEPRANERRRLRDQWIRESDATHDSFMRAYKEKYWADAILLRRELYRRLRKAAREAQQGGIYQHPTNVLGVEAIADNLELLAKSLPDS
jgi:hypothetical protein